MSLLTLSANINAPASMTNSDVSSSLTTAAVRPAAELAFPLVYTALGLNSSTALSKQIKKEIQMDIVGLYDFSLMFLVTLIYKQYYIWGFMR